MGAFSVNITVHVTSVADQKDFFFHEFTNLCDFTNPYNFSSLIIVLYYDMAILTSRTFQVLRNAIFLEIAPPPTPS